MSSPESYVSLRDLRSRLSISGLGIHMIRIKGPQTISGFRIMLCFHFTISLRHAERATWQRRSLSHRRILISGDCTRTFCGPLNQRRFCANTQCICLGWINYRTLTLSFRIGPGQFLGIAKIGSGSQLRKQKTEAGYGILGSLIELSIQR